MAIDRLQIDIEVGHFALFREPAVAPFDAPFTAPLAHLELVKVHSALAYLQLAVEIDITINHAAVAASHGWDWSTFSNNWTPEAYSIDRLLGTHNLGSIPICIVASGEGIVDPGFPIQTNGSGGARYLDIYLTETEVRARERVDSGTGALPALNRTYKLLVLREPTVVDADLVFSAEDGNVVAAGGLFNDDFHYLRAVAAGESPYRAGITQQIDTAGGICKFIDPLNSPTYDFYQPSAYTGSLVSVSTVEVQR